MATWGICTLTNNPVDQVLAFVAHHLELGADTIHLFFDDPDDPAADALSGIDRVKVVRCDDAHWAKSGRSRPRNHQVRQTRNLARVYRKTSLDWLLHIDIDEFVVTDQPVGRLLDEADAGKLAVRLEPFEALYDSHLQGEPFNGRLFRRRIKDPHVLSTVFGPYAVAMDVGMLSHVRGKQFIRSKVPGLVLHIHHAEIGDQTTLGEPFHPSIRLLHFHADDQDAWIKAAHRRAERGAYRFRPELKKLLLDADEAGLREFHRKVHMPGPAELELLRDKGLLTECDLHLSEKIAALRKTGNPDSLWARLRSKLARRPAT